MKMKKEQNYRVIAGEGDGQGHTEGYATTLRGARRMAAVASCNGDRWTYIEECLGGKKNSMGQELTGWRRMSDND